jgi:cytochrome c2
MSLRMRTMTGWLAVVGVLALTLTAWAHMGEKHKGKPGEEYWVKVSPELGEAGRAIFKKSCLICHNAISPKAKVGPSLKGLFKAKLTPVMKHPVSDANIRDHIWEGGKKMPPFPDIKGKDMDALIAYLKTL